jgi:hypothetical protein
MPEKELGPNIISGLMLEKNAVKMKSGVRAVISAKQAESLKTGKVQIIGGDSDDVEQDSPPAIIIEKENDRISKIIVKCPCGRHAELVCEYNEET